MDLSKILSITGKPGLYLILSQTKSGALVESLLDKKRFPVFINEKISTLSEISIFTIEEDISLKEVFHSIYKKENGGKCIDTKSDNNALKNYMLEVLPNYDQDRVYVSDMKKLFSWYNLLQSVDMLDFSEETKPENDELKVTE
jgi:hypothetical protein